MRRAESVDFDRIKQQPGAASGEPTREAPSCKYCEQEFPLMTNLPDAHREKESNDFAAWCRKKNPQFASDIERKLAAPAGRALSEEQVQGLLQNVTRVVPFKFTNNHEYVRLDEVVDALLRASQAGSKVEDGGK